MGLHKVVAQQTVVITYAWLSFRVVRSNDSAPMRSNVKCLLNVFRRVFVRAHSLHRCQSLSMPAGLVPTMAGNTTQQHDTGLPPANADMPAATLDTFGTWGRTPARHSP